MEFMMLAAVVCVAAFSVVSAQDSVTTELSKILKRSRYFVAKLEMVADELQVSTEALKDGMQNLSSPLRVGAHSEKPHQPRILNHRLARANLQIKQPRPQTKVLRQEKT